MFFAMSKSKNLPHYRNKEDILTEHATIIDAGSLFIFQKGVLILVDDDFFYETDLDLNLFEKA